ncbi:RNA 2',3'-cyclic phosphodiesterase [Alkalilimnicola sp. S0819]|uniref:RNA 2',3'-cyclic phosphodiesterase n=1 Tax=Alkalilimnicola sp. S0819 TaxID=2613922 RepID=UPI0012625C51|nr:RNA 2',3'-cyclic phosphodiesterase [Alkalilimnicola sp. S0819]KAB7619734.1 RNA 2',3'-cyclic phosphodiesterase [Alkalilimnicola sp. S0819]MPQ17497.1 RNA 2',3'-cyclic phosphodiesterase [Alkalilimnicola sp. S0819]
MNQAPPRARLFFALWPEPALRRELARIQHERVGSGRAVPVANLHLTVLFLGLADPAQAMRVADGLRVPPFEVCLRREGYWRNGIHWLAPESTPPELSRLHDGLREGLAAQGHAFERRDYRPHVTLARRARPAPGRALPPLRWPVTDHALVESRPRPQGPEYRVLRRWPLG